MTRDTVKELGERLASCGRLVREGARLMIGVPNYDTYVAHMQEAHPGHPVMTYAEFFRDRQSARYGDGVDAALP